MRIYVSLLFILLVINLYAAVSVSNITQKVIRIITFILLILCMLRYVSLYIFLISKSPDYLYNIRYFVLASAVSIPVVSYISIRLLNGAKTGVFDAVFIAAVSAGYFFMIFNATDGVIPEDIGYKVAIKQSWTYIITIAQGIFTGFMIYLSLDYLLKIRAAKNRIINLIFLMGFISAIIEGLMVLFNKAGLHTMLVSEGIILAAICSSLNLMSKNSQ
jgi:hypothetical protein